MGGFLDSRGSSAYCVLWMPRILRKYVQTEGKAEKERQQSVNNKLSLGDIFSFCSRQEMGGTSAKLEADIAC